MQRQAPASHHVLVAEASLHNNFNHGRTYNGVNSQEKIDAMNIGHILLV